MLAGDGQEELADMDTKRLAIEAAGKAGVNRPGLSNTSAPYPVNAAGVHNDDVLFQRNGQKIDKYRIDIQVSGGI